jgi:16S rRNA (cytosine1402-N4)-methyltransferase
MTDEAHIPVLAEETMASLKPKSGEVAVDLTVGLGGHASLMAERVGTTGTVVGFDLDASNLARATQRLQSSVARFIPIHARFTEAPMRLAALGLRADVVLADLGFSSNQMEDSARGFSFAADGPLDMRLDPSQSVSAADLVAAMDETGLADLIYRYGEDPFARRIARKLAQIRQREPIRTTARLAEAVVEAYGPRARSSRMHPATRTFMALRIAVNDELGSLQTLLDHIRVGSEEAQRTGWLRDGARVGVISFHSLEDRLVKRAFADMSKQSLAERLTRKPVIAGDEETRSNPRSRSAKFRAISIAAPTIPFERI